MSALIIVAIVLVSVAFYCGAAGAVGLGFYRNRKSSCDSCSGRDKGRYSYGCNKDHDTPAWSAGALWPLVLPALVGMSLVDRQGRSDRRTAALHAEIERLESELNVGDRRG